MLKNLFNLKYKRTNYEVLIFYFVYTIPFLFVCMLLNGLFTMLIFPDAKNTEDIIDAGQKVSSVLVPVYSVIVTGALSAAIIMSKKIYKEKKVIITAVIALIASLFGVIVGFVPMTLLTTYDNKENV